MASISTVKADATKSFKAKFVATLSDGSTAVEETGHWTTVPGKRKPWVRLVEYAAKEGLHITSLRLNFNGRTIHMPREKFDKFNMTSVAPSFYSLAYHLEVDDVMGANDQTYYVDLAAHYGDFTVHYVQDVTDGSNSWVAVTSGDSPLAPSPSR